MDQDKVNPFVGNTEAPAGGAPVSDASASSSSTAASGSTPSVPVNPYAPAGAPYAPGSNTPAPDYATPYAGGTYDSPDTAFSNDPAVPNTGSSAYTSFSPAPSQNQDIYIPSGSPEKPKLFTKKFIIFAIIGLVLIIAAVVAGVLIQNNKKTNDTTSKQQTPTSAGPASENDIRNIKSYTNYIVSGTESDTETQNLLGNIAGYFISKKLGNVFSPDINAMRSMVGKWQAFSSSFSTDSEILKNSVIDYQKIVDFFKAYSENPPYTDEELLKIYQDNNKDSLEQKYSNYRTVSDTGNEYAIAQVEYGLAMFDRFSVYKNHDCLGDDLNLECVEKQKFSAEEESLLTKNIDYKHKSREIYSSQLNLITTKINFIYDVVAGVTEEQYEKEA